MYNAIQLTRPENDIRDVIGDAFDVLNQFSESASGPRQDWVFYEAVFSGGKEKIKPIVEQIAVVKDILEKEIGQQDASYKKAEEAKKNDPKAAPKKVKEFNPQAFWKNTAFKELEDRIRNIFGFRNVGIYPYIEKYNSKQGMFESKELNCGIWSQDRFPIDGLVTDNGFYDKTHSINMEMFITLGLIKALSAEEITAVMLHEFGHGIDPALVTIQYHEANILSKYLTDRKDKITNGEKKIMKKFSDTLGILGIAVIALGAATIGHIIDRIKWKFKGEKIKEEKINELRNLVKKDKDKFDRQNAAEAFADNFARMYGYGPQLASGLRKLAKADDDRISSRIKRERDRFELITYMTERMLKDEHKTEVHRIHALLKEYKADIEDPNTTPHVKKQLQEDMEELQKVYDEYMNNFSEIQNRINRAIREELELKDAQEKPDEAVKESVEYFDESKKGWEKMMAAIKAPTPDDQKEFKKIFGEQECSLAKDKDGYYVTTHRCRSKSYESIDKIPKKDVEFVSSTS